MLIFCSCNVFIVSVLKYYYRLPDMPKVNKKYFSTFDTKEAKFLFENEANSDWFPDGTKGNNITGYPYFIVPNIVHYLMIDITEISFGLYISIRSVLRHQKPDRIYIHTNSDIIEGKYWSKLINEIQSDLIIVRKIAKPLTVFGFHYSKKFYNWHISDILRNKVLIY